MPITSLQPSKDMTWEAFNKFYEMNQNERMFQQGVQERNRQYGLDVQKFQLDMMDEQQRAKYNESQARLLDAQSAALKRQDDVYKANPTLAREEIEAGIAAHKAQADNIKLQKEVEAQRIMMDNIRLQFSQQAMFNKQVDEFRDGISKSPYLTPGDVSIATNGYRQALATGNQEVINKFNETFNKQVESKASQYVNTNQFGYAAMDKLRGDTQNYDFSNLDARVYGLEEKAKAIDPNLALSPNRTLRYAPYFKKQIVNPKINDINTDTSVYASETAAYLQGTNGVTTADEFGGIMNPIRKAYVDKEKKSLFIDVDTAKEYVKNGQMSEESFQKTFKMSTGQVEAYQKNYQKQWNDPKNFYTTPTGQTTSGNPYEGLFDSQPLGKADPNDPNSRQNLTPNNVYSGTVKGEISPLNAFGVTPESMYQTPSLGSSGMQNWMYDWNRLNTSRMISDNNNY